MAIAPPPPPQATASSYVFFCGFLALILFLIWYSVSGTPQPPARYDNAKPRVEPITGFRKLHAADRQPPRGSGPAADISKLRPHPEPAEIPKIRTAGCQPPAEFAAEIHASDSQPPPASAEIPKAHGAESQPHTEPEATLEGIAGSSTAAEEANTTLTQRSATPSPVKKNDYWSYARRVKCSLHTLSRKKSFQECTIPLDDLHAQMQADTAVIGNLGIKWKAGVKNELKKLARARLVHFPGESQIDIPGYTADIFLRVDSDAKVARSNNNEFARMKAITAQLEKDFKAKEEEICESDKRHRAEARQARTEKGLPITPSLGPGSFDDAGTESHHVDHPMAGPSNEASADADTDMPPPGEGVATLRREKISVQPTEWELVNDELDAVKLQNADLRAQLARVEADLFAKEAQLSESKAKEQALRDRMLVEAEYQEDLLRDLEHATEEVRRIGKERDDIQRKFDTIKQTMRSALEAAD